MRRSRQVGTMLIAAAVLVIVGLDTYFDWKSGALKELAAKYPALVPDNPWLAWGYAAIAVSLIGLAIWWPYRRFTRRNRRNNH